MPKDKIEDTKRGITDYVTNKQSSTGKSYGHVYECCLTDANSGKVTHVVVDLHI